MTEPNDDDVDLTLYSRKNKFQNIIDQFNGDIEYDPEFIQSALEDVKVRDALFHFVSDKYQIGLFGELECTIEDCSITRKAMATLLVMVCTDVGATGNLTTALAGIALLDGSVEACEYMVTQTLDNDPTPLAYLMKKSLQIKEVAEVWKDSVEETSIEIALAGV